MNAQPIKYSQIVRPSLLKSKFGLATSFEQGEDEQEHSKVWFECLIPQFNCHLFQMKAKKIDGGGTTNHKSSKFKMQMMEFYWLYNYGLLFYIYIYTPL